jgi:hypothetical protein
MTNGRRAALQTYHAIQASDLATAFNDALKKMRIGPGDYGIELTAPEGPSTAGGVQALQHVRLVPREMGLPTLVVGHANHPEGRAELRTYEHVEAIHLQRFRRPLALDRAQYEQVLAMAKQMLDVLRLETVIAGPPVETPEEEERVPLPRATRASKALVVSVVGLCVLLLGLGLWLWLGTTRLS